MVNAAFFDGAGNAHAAGTIRSVERLVFGDGVVIGLALAVTEPGQNREANQDYTNADAEFCATFHDGDSALNRGTSTTGSRPQREGRAGMQVSRIARSEKGLRRLGFQARFR